MREKVYTSISLPPEVIDELDRWQKAYEEYGLKLTKEKLLLTIFEGNRRFLFKDKNNKRNIVTNYKAICLAERDSIDYEEARTLVQKNDADTLTNRYGRYGRWRTGSDYTLDKDIDTIKPPKK